MRFTSNLQTEITQLPLNKKAHHFSWMEDLINHIHMKQRETNRHRVCVCGGGGWLTLTLSFQVMCSIMVMSLCIWKDGSWKDLWHSRHRHRKAIVVHSHTHIHTHTYTHIHLYLHTHRLAMRLALRLLFSGEDWSSMNKPTPEVWGAFPESVNTHCCSPSQTQWEVWVLWSAWVWGQTITDHFSWLRWVFFVSWKGRLNWIIIWTECMLWNPASWHYSCMTIVANEILWPSFVVFFCGSWIWSVVGYF